MAYPDERKHVGIRPIKHLVEDDLLAMSGVVGVDIGEKVTAGRPTGRSAIVVYVRDKRPAGRLSIPTAILGVPTDVVEEFFVLHRALASLEGVGIAERHELLLGGIGVGPSRLIRFVPPDVPVPDDYLVAGTLGALVATRVGTPQVMALTSFHVACVDDAWVVGDPMVHPSRVDGGRPVVDEIGTLARAALSGTVDGAALLLAPGRALVPEVVGLGPVSGSARAEVGTLVRKRGRTTGVTYGVVVSTDAVVSLDFGTGIGVRTLYGQVRVEALPGHRFGDHGDSGAVLLDEANRVVGLYCAGNATGSMGFANPIDRVLDQLDVNVLTPGAGVTRTPGRAV